MKVKKTVTVEMVLEYDDQVIGQEDDGDFEAIEIMLHNMQPNFRSGRASVRLYALTVVNGLVDRDGVPVESASYLLPPPHTKLSWRQT